MHTGRRAHDTTTAQAERYHGDTASYQPLPLRSACEPASAAQPANSPTRWFVARGSSAVQVSPTGRSKAEAQAWAVANVQGFYTVYSY
jgi:hypothetical protein